MVKQTRKTLDDVLNNIMEKITTPAMEYLITEFGAGLTERFFYLCLPSMYTLAITGRGDYLKKQIKKEFDSGKLRRNVHYEIGKGVGTASALIFDVGLIYSYFNLFF